MNRKKYFVRIHHPNQHEFETHTFRNLIPITLLSNDWGAHAGTHFYSIEATTEELLALKLSIPIIGYTEVSNTLGNTLGRFNETHIV